MTEDHLLEQLREFLRWPEDGNLSKRDFLMRVSLRIETAVRDETYIGGKNAPKLRVPEEPD